MQRLIIAMVFLGTVLCSCKKNQDVSLVGVWQWTSSVGGIAVNTVLPTTNTIVTVHFNSDLTYTTYINNQINTYGKYSVSTNQNYTYIHFDKAIVVDKLLLFNDQVISKIGTSMLTLYDNNVSDGYGHYFKK